MTRSTRTRRSMDRKTNERSRINALPFAEQLLAPHGAWRRSEYEVRSVCPFHSGAANRTQFRVRFDGRFVCFSCGEHGNLVDLLMKLNHLSYRQAVELVGDLPKPRVSLDDIPVLTSYEDRKKPKEEYETFPESAIALYRKNCPTLLLERGFSEEVLQRFNIGYDRQTWRICIPVRDVNAKIVGIAWRADFNYGDGPKYSNTFFEKTRHLYGLHLWAGKGIDTLYVVEGYLDAVRMTQLGEPAVAVMGAYMDRAQRDLLVNKCNARRVVLAFDNDDAGRVATQQSIRMLSKTRFGPSLGVFHYGAKDPGELTGFRNTKIEHWTSTLL